MPFDRPESNLQPVPTPSLPVQAPGRRLMALLTADAAAGAVSLSSPEHRVAQRIQRGVGQAAHGRRVARLLAADPVLSAKALRAACSGARLKRPRSLPQIVARLDRHYVGGLVAAATEAESPFDRHDLMRRTGRSLWQASLRVSAISYLLANLDGRFDAEEAALAGLLHNLGDLALLSRAGQDASGALARDLPDALRQHGAEAGEQVARIWGFPTNLVQVAACRGDWFRDHPDPADMCDLVLVAQFHAAMGQAIGEKLPPLRSLPALRRLDLGDTDPAFSLNLLEAANNALALTQRQLARL